MDEDRKVGALHIVGAFEAVFFELFRYYTGVLAIFEASPLVVIRDRCERSAFAPIVDLVESAYLAFGPGEFHNQKGL